MKKDVSCRFQLIDALRGFALLNMVVFHFCYDAFVVCGRDPLWFTDSWVIVWERFICITFILISGVSLHFSQHAYRRALIVSLGGMLITLVTVVAVPSQTVWYGVLSLIGCSMLLVKAAQRWLDRIDPFCGAGLSLALFAVFYGVPERYIGFFYLKMQELPEGFYQFRGFAFLGFPDSEFCSGDYFPLIPWLFIFLLGYYLWSVVRRCHAEVYFRRGFRPLNFLGRHALVLYLIHQPILMGVCFLIFGYI